MFASQKNKRNIGILYYWAYDIAQYMAITIPLTQRIRLIAHLLQTSLGETAPLTQQRRSAVSYCIWPTSSRKTVTGHLTVRSSQKYAACPRRHKHLKWEYDSIAPMVPLKSETETPGWGLDLFILGLLNCWLSGKWKSQIYQGPGGLCLTVPLHPWS